MNKLLIIVLSFLTFSLFATEVYVKVDGAVCNISKDCYDRFESEVVEKAVMNSQLCFVGDSSGVHGILEYDAEFSDEFSYFQINLGETTVDFAYYDNFSYYDQGNTDEPTVRNIGPYITSNVFVQSCY